MESFRDIIAAWPSRADLAVDAGATDSGVVKQWHLRDSIPAARWPAIVAAAARRGIHGITLEVLVELAAARRRSVTIATDTDHALPVDAAAVDDAA